MASTRGMIKNLVSDIVKNGFFSSDLESHGCCVHVATDFSTLDAFNCRKVAVK